MVDLAPILEQYRERPLTVATATSHTSLQIFHGARREGFRTLGIALKQPPRYYEAFPLARPDDFLVVKDWDELHDRAGELQDRGVVLVPHGSFVEYMGWQSFRKLAVPVLGNRGVLEWEADREKSRQWLESAGLTMPRKIQDPRDIIRPVIVKYHGAKGGRGYFIARSYNEYRRKVDATKAHVIQEFVLGTRYYMSYFFSPIVPDYYHLRDGSLQLMSIDRRDETNIDEAHRLGSLKELEEMGIEPTFVVTGNIPMVLRESLLDRVFEMGASVVNRAYDMFGGLWGPFCLEAVVTDDLKFTTFEISARIVAGTNPYTGGSPYSEMIEPGLSTGRRIAQELRVAQKRRLLPSILT